MGGLVSSLCLCILNENLDASCVNQTLITLILEVHNPMIVSQFKLISLCNVIYKIVAKCVAMRVKHIIEMVISETQSAFVGRR